jgi:hypothetical protein
MKPSTYHIQMRFPCATFSRLRAALVVLAICGIAVIAAEQMTFSWNKRYPMVAKKASAFGALLAVLGCCLGSTVAGEPFSYRKLPGVTKGKADARWIAPYVLATKYSVAGKGVTTVRWYDESGSVIKELTGPALHASPECITEEIDGTGILRPVQGKWKIAVPFKTEMGGYIKGDRFVHEFHPVEGEIALDIYVTGKLVGSAGPFVSFKGMNVELADDGSLALMTWKTSEKQAAQVVVIGPDGKTTFRADCEEDMYHPYPVAGGAGVLLRVESHQKPPVRFRYSSGGGPWVTHEVGPNARPVLSLPDEEKVLFSTSIGEAERFKLIDCGSGKLLWEIWPVEGFAGTPAAVVFEGKIFFMGRDLAAVDIKSGNIIARWEPNVLRDERGWFVRRGTRLFIVTDDEFVELNASDIVAKMNGWY